MNEIDFIRPYDNEVASPGVTMGTPPRQISPLKVLWRGRWIVLLCMALALGGGFAYLSTQTPIYSSSTRIDVETEGPKIINDSLGNPTQSTNYLATQCELIKSSQILAPVAELPELRSMKTFEGVDNPIGRLKASTSALTNKLDDLITISFESPYPSEAAAVANAIVESYRNYHSSRKRSTAAEVLRILTKEKRDRDEELNTKLHAMLAFKQANPNMSYAGDKGNIILERLGKLSDALGTSRLEVLDAKANAEGAKAMAQNPAQMEQWMKMQGGAAPLASEVRRMEVELNAMRQTVLPEHASIKALQLRIEDLKASIREQAKESFDAYLAAVEQRYATARQHEQELKELFDEQQKLALGLNTMNTEYAMLETETRRLERLCDLLDSRIKEVKITEDTGAMNITVLEAARPAFVPIKPNRPVLLFQALIAGFVLGGSIAYLRERMDHRLHTVEEVRTTLSLPILGAIPRMLGSDALPLRGQKVLAEPMSDVAEAYRTVRTAVFFGARGDKAKTLVVTSPAPGDGKSISASNLAIAMAQAGQRVLLIDADMRKPSQHKIFELEDDLGLTSVVTGKAPFGKAVKLSSIAGLYVLPAGPIPRNPAEILTSAFFKQLIDKLRTKFDHIVIDSPPVGLVTDAGILGGLCDFTILVVRANKSTRWMSTHARNNLISVGAKILGVIANDVRSREGGEDYPGYGYGYGHYANGRGMVAARSVRSLEGNGEAAQESFAPLAGE